MLPTPSQKDTTKKDTIRMVFGYALLLLITLLAAAIGLGKVEEKTSYGLRDIIMLLSVLTGSWSQWAFNTTHPPPQNSSNQPATQPPDTPEQQPPPPTV